MSGRKSPSTRGTRGTTTGKAKGAKAPKGGRTVTPKRAPKARLKAGGAPAAGPARDTGPDVDPTRAREFGRRLRAWYRRNARDLPWRRTRDPYHVLVSELMLQQTQVARVVDYYARFLARFPTLRHVAEAEPHHVTAEWAGLGYYARARNLHALARQVHADGAAGVLPPTPQALRALPGIGAYTAGAVASFAFERRAALVDTNVARVLARVFAPGTDVKTGRGQKLVWGIAETILPRRGPEVWTHNQALMELGALVCTARVRRCAGCPVKPVCLTHAAKGCPEDGQASFADTPAFMKITRRKKR
jgi:A/G-specific adenine glycosylase